MNAKTFSSEERTANDKAVYDLADIGCRAVFKKSLIDAASLAGRPFTTAEIAALASLGARLPKSADNALE